MSSDSNKYENEDDLGTFILSLLRLLEVESIMFLLSIYYCHSYCLAESCEQFHVRAQIILFCFWFIHTCFDQKTRKRGRDHLNF